MVTRRKSRKVTTPVQAVPLRASSVRILPLVIAGCAFGLLVGVAFHLLSQTHPTKLSFAQDTATWQQFYRWLISNGANISKLAVAYFPELGRGLVLMEDVIADQPVVTIPKQLAFTTSRIRKLQPAIVEALQLLNFNLTDDQFLALALQREKLNPHSFWQPYFDVLPKEYPTMPLNFSAHDLSYADGTVSDHIRLQRQAFEVLATAVHKLAHTRPQLFFGYEPSNEQVKWAYLTVISRHFKIPGGIGIVPFVDMANHSPEGTMLGVDQEGALYVAPKMMKLGDQFFAKYYDSRRSDAIGLVEYGFLFSDSDNNPAVEFSYNFEILSTDPLVVAKEYWIETLACRHRQFLLRTKDQHFPPDLLLKCLQIAVADDRDSLRAVENEISGIADVRYSVKLPRLLQAAFEKAREIIEQRLTQYRTSIEADERLLRTDATLSVNARNLIKLRLSEKLVWKHILALLAKQPTR